MRLSFFKAGPYPFESVGGMVSNLAIFNSLTEIEALELLGFDSAKAVSYTHLLAAHHGQLAFVAGHIWQHLLAGLEHGFAVDRRHLHAGVVESHLGSVLHDVILRILSSG